MVYNITLVEDERLPDTEIMNFRKEFLSNGENSINGSRG